MNGRKEGTSVGFFFISGGRGWKIQLEISYRLQKDPGADERAALERYLDLVFFPKPSHHGTALHLGERNFSQSFNLKLSSLSTKRCIRRLDTVIAHQFFLP